MDVLNLRLRSGLLHRNSPLQRFKRLEQASVFDWTRTKAFALMGSSCAGVYVNLEGREQNGVVPRDQYEQVRQALIDRVQDIDTLEGIRAYRREDLYSGSSLDSMPDVVVIPGDGYHIATALSDSGDFLSLCTDQTGEHRMEGILVIQSKSVEQRSEQSAVDQATIFDIAPTVLRLFGLPVPADMDGKVLINKTDWAPPVAALAPETIAHTELSSQSESYSSEDEEAIRQRLADLGYMD
jgi:predicted AlkP superfamily phosphohydrolase/phosphomutase